MGSRTFYNDADSGPVDEVFDDLVEASLQYNGDGGYSGTIAEKTDFVVIYDGDGLRRELVEDRIRTLESAGPCLGSARAGRELSLLRRRLGSLGPGRDMTALQLAELLIDIDDSRVADKWGPAGAILRDDGGWLFFGEASC